MANYQIPIGTHQCEIEVKRSRFIAYATHTSDVESAKDFIHSLKEKYPDARHHCYGFMASAPWNSNGYGFSDDNEPSGTAGMPIFSHLKHNNIGEITIVVVRYFGGTKLGTGGLSRAYSEAAKKVLEGLKLKEHVEMRILDIKIDFAQEADIRHKIQEAQGNILNAAYGEKVTLTVEVPFNANLNLPYSAEPSKSTI